jgi:protein gp37
MSDHSKIEWTDATWNPLRGCAIISPGCKHCYAQAFAERFRRVPGHPYEQGFDLRLVPEKLSKPFTWPSPRTVFVNSMSDLFQPTVPDDYIEEVAGAMMGAVALHYNRIFRTFGAGPEGENLTCSIS